MRTTKRGTTKNYSSAKQKAVIRPEGLSDEDWAQFCKDNGLISTTMEDLRSANETFKKMGRASGNRHVRRANRVLSKRAAKASITKHVSVRLKSLSEAEVVALPVDLVPPGEEK